MCARQRMPAIDVKFGGIQHPFYKAGLFLTVHVDNAVLIEGIFPNIRRWFMKLLSYLLVGVRVTNDDASVRP